MWSGIKFFRRKLRYLEDAKSYAAITMVKSGTLEFYHSPYLYRYSSSRLRDMINLVTFSSWKISTFWVISKRWKKSVFSTFLETQMTLKKILEAEKYCLVTHRMVKFHQKRMCQQKVIKFSSADGLTNVRTDARTNSASIVYTRGNPVRFAACKQHTWAFEFTRDFGLIIWIWDKLKSLNFSVIFRFSLF